MSGGDVARERNTREVDSLRGDFVARGEFYGDGARCQSFISTHAGGGGNLRFGHLIDNSNWLYGRAGSLLTENVITCSNYTSTFNGGPCVLYNGTTRYFSSPDAAWQEPTNNSFLVGGWVWASVLATTRWVVSKINPTGNQRSWGLGWSQTTGSFIFRCNDLGTAVGDVEVASSYIEQTGKWYMLFGLFVPGVLMRIYVASPSDNDLTIDSLVAGVPASLFNGTSFFAIGTRSGPAELWSGFIGMLLGRCAVLTAQVDDHVRRLWNETRQLYLA